MNPNHYKVQRERGVHRKMEMVKYKGGKCEICGYDKNLSALEFHHINPEEKCFQLDTRHLSNTSIDKIKNEVDKCMLLCSNCHKEMHYKELNISLLNEIKEENKHVSVLGPNKRQIKCSVCGNEFAYSKGKKYCSKQCRDIAEGRDNRPTKEELYKKYDELRSWSKVANFYGITRKVTQIIRNS